jgi:hypothetical protein
MPGSGDFWSCRESICGEVFLRKEPETPLGKCPYGQPGDLLWVRESVWIDIEPVSQLDPPQKRAFFTDTNKVRFQDGRDDGDAPFPLHPEHLRALKSQKLTPSIHMPRWASRITLEIKSVRVERLNEISEGDAADEGAGIMLPDHEYLDGNPDQYRQCYRMIWEQINGPGSWDANPWVWAVTFRVLGKETA